MNNDRELVVTRLVDAPRAHLFAAWTDPELFVRWFAPAPLTTYLALFDPRSGGAFKAAMRTPEGEEFPMDGVFLEIVKDERIVFTDAFTGGWEPQAEPFMVAIVTLEDEDGRSRYTARVRHWTVEAKEKHLAMGYEAGWNQCLDQLVALVTKTEALV